ncbi:MAG: ABC transporter permease [Sarcina sp.]
MFFNIAKNNLKKSFKDYSIYFLTLSFAVCIFYAFNSIGSQSAMTTLNDSQKEYMTVMNNVTNVLSIFVSVILGALIIYANNFLIKRRKKELGIYMTLGMGKNKISRLLVLETLMVGIISLIVGLIVGLIVSQGLSVLTTKLFGGIIAKMGFVISYSAIIKTCIYFGIIFVLVMIFNTVIVSKYKLIDLLTASKKNEKIKVKNPILLLVIFLVGAGLLIAGYTVILKNGLNSEDALYVAIGLGFVGTFLFFYGLAGFMVMISQKNKNRYLRGLNIFTTKQMNNKINTTFVSMALISLMLFVTISALSTGVSMKKAMADSVKNNTPFDVSIAVFNTSNSDKGLSNKEINAELNKIYPNFKNEFNSEEYSTNSYNNNIKISSNSGTDIEGYTQYITVSDYNKYLSFIGKPQISLTNNNVLLITSQDSLVKKLNGILKDGAKMNIGKNEYNIQNDKVITNVLENSVTSINLVTFIVPNNFISENKGEGWSLSQDVVINANAKQKNDSVTSQKSLLDTMNKYNDIAQKTNNDAPYYLVSTRDDIVDSAQGMTTIVLFIAIYIGVIFLLTSAAVIALQQLVEATDSKDRYDVLRKIGATNKMINKAIFKQVVTAFALPLILAIIDSVVAIKAVSSFVEMFGKSGIVGASVITAGVIVVIYGGYMLATYFGFKNAVKENK